MCIQTAHKFYSMMFKQLPTIISNISQLGDAANKLKAINFSVVGLNSGNIDAYRNAVSLLSKEQASLLLSSKGLNQAQIDLILSNKEVTASEIAEAAATASTAKVKSVLTTEQQKQLVSSGAITSEKLAEVAATLGLETAESGALVAKKALNLETVKQQLTSMGIVGATQTQIISMLGLATAETGAATAGNVLTGVMTRLSLAMSTNPIGALVTVVGLAITAVWGLSKAFDALADSAEEIDERVDSLIEKYNEAKKSAEQNASTVESLASEYEELSKGVNNLGENVSLTSDEYDRYNEIVNQIADMFPDLISGYTEEGNAILSLKGNVEGLRDAYKEAQTEAYNTLIASGENGDGNDIIKQWKDVHDPGFFAGLFDLGSADVGGKISVSDALAQLEEIQKLTAEEYRNIENITAAGSHKEIESLTDIQKEIGYGSYIGKALGIDGNVTDKEFEEAKKQAKALVQTYNAEIESALSDVETLANAYLMTNDDYSKLTDSSKTAASLLVNNLTEDIASDFSSKEDVGSWVDSVVSKLQNNPTLSNAINGLFTTDLSNMSVDEAKAVVDQYINTIAKILEEDPVDVKVRLGFDDYNDDDIAPLKTKVQGFLKDEFDDKVGELSLDDLQVASKLEIPEGTLLSWDELKQKIEETKNAVSNETPILKSIPETVSDLEDLNKELDKLGTAMANVDSEGNFDLGDLDAVADYFLDLEDVTYNVSAVSNALKTLGDGTSTLEEQKNAINDLADEYLKTSGILDQLNESNAELIKLQLQRMGIENSEEIVNAALQNEQSNLSIKAQLQQVLIDQGLTLSNVTASEIEMMQQEGIVAQQNAQYLAALALQKQIQNGALDESSNIANLQALAAQMGATGSTISYWLGIISHAGSASVADKAKENATNAINEALSKFSNTTFKTSIPKVKYNGGTPVKNALNKNKNSGSGSKSKQNKSINEIDFFKRRVDVLNDALELLKQNLDNVVGYDAKNTLLNQSISITQEEIKNYSDALQMYSKKASDALSKVPDAYRDAAKNGKVELLTEEVLGSAADENDKTVKELVDDYTSWADSVADAKQKLAELKTELRQLELDKFKNIVEDYTNRTDIFENSQDLINKQIDLFEEAGQVIGEGFYTSLIDEENKKLSLLNEEQQKLVQEMSDGISNGTIEKGTDEWNEMIKSISEVNGSILDSKKAVEEFNNSIQQLHWDTVDRIKSDFSELSNEIEFLYNLLADDEHVSDDFGNWSDNALAQLGLMTQSYEEHVYASQKLQNEIDNLTKAYKNGEYSETEYLEKLYDLKDEQRSEVEVSEQAKDSIVSLAKARVDIMVNAINKEVDAMSDLIDKKKDALSAEKELHDYRQSIEESTKNITKLEQQLAAMQGDDTASTIAKRKKLEEELANAKADLEEQEYSHSIDAQQNALDQQLQDFKDKKDAEIEYLQQYLENEEQVIYDAFELIKQNTETVSNSITMIAQDHGYQVSNTLTSSWQAGENAITSYNQAITDASSVFSQNLTTMQNAEWNLQQQANTTAIAVASVYTASADNLLMQLTNSYVAESNLKQMTDALHDSLIKCLDGGYNIGSLVTQLHGVADAANSAANAVSNLMNSFAGGGKGTYQYGTGNTVYYTDDKGQKHVTSEAQAKKAGYTAPTSDRQDLIQNQKKKTSKKAKGGLITKKSAGSFDEIAKSVGEDHMISVQDDEFVLTPVQTQAWLKLVDNLDNYNAALRSNISMKPYDLPLRDNLSGGGITLNYDHLIEVQGDVNNSNIKEIENAVNDSVNKQIKEFTTTLKRVGVR